MFAPIWFWENQLKKILKKYIQMLLKLYVFDNLIAFFRTLSICMYLPVWPDEFVKKSPKMFNKTFYNGKSSRNIWATFFIFMYITAQSSLSPNRRKIAQSGYPGTYPWMYF
jgi:hypothetical protein